MMVGEVPRCLTVKTAVHHDTHLGPSFSCPAFSRNFAYVMVVLVLTLSTVKRNETFNLKTAKQERNLMLKAAKQKVFEPKLERRIGQIQL